MVKRRWYLAHPLDSRHLIREWEVHVESEFDVELMNPFYDADDRTDVQSIDEGRTGRYEGLDPKAIVLKDLAAIASCEGTVAVVDGSVSYGTIMEIVYTFAVMNKPVYIICTNGHEQHPWLRYHADFVFASFYEFEEWLSFEGLEKGQSNGEQGIDTSAD